MDAERKARLGARRTCTACAAAFYDLQKADAPCPKCGAKQSEPPPSKAKRPSKKAKGRGAPRQIRTEPVARREDEAGAPLDDDDVAPIGDDLDS